LATPPKIDAQTKSFIERVFAVERHEIGAMFAAFFFMFCVWISYTVLRPVRDAMGITSGVAKLPMLFWATFVVTLAVQPIYGWIASRFRRAVFLPWVYGFMVLNLVGFYFWFHVEQNHTWIARVFFVWLTVYAVFVLSVCWSLCVDVFTAEQAERLFGFIAAGTSLGGVVGPLLASQLAVPFGRANLLLIAVAFHTASLIFMRYLIRWQQVQQRDATAATRAVNERPIGGNPLSGLYQVFTSRHLFGIAIFVFVLTWINTFLYLPQAALVAQAIPDSDKQTALFSTIDFWVNAGTLLIQMFALSRLTSKLGMVSAILILPIAMIFGFSWLALNPVLSVLIPVMIFRRIGEYGIMRPCREMVFTTAPRESKYKAKNVIDTFVYRGGDALSASAYAGLTSLLGLTISGVAWTGALLAALWGVSAYVIARRHEALSRAAV
jgi:AAA family ATP:ADP antiporter